MIPIYDYDVFLSHSSADKAWVEGLGHDLESNCLGDRNLKVFLDKWDIPGGANIPLHLDGALKKSAFILLVMSPEMLTSDWCTAEWTSQFYSDPTNRLGRILPIRFRDLSLDKSSRIDVPSFLANLNYFDYRTPGDYKRETERLVARIRGERPPRGGRSRQAQTSAERPESVELPATRADPDGEPETLLSNARLVTSTAGSWSARTSLSRPLPSAPEVPNAVVRGGVLHSFSDPTADGNPYRSHISSALGKSDALEEWTEPDKRAVLMELLKLEMVRYLAQFDIGFDRSHSRFVVQPKGPGSRSVRTGTGRARAIVRAPDPGKTGFWIHQTAWLEFTFLGPRLILTVEPSLLFTTDGHRHVGRDMIPGLQAQWTGRERNKAILANILLWIDLLTQGRRRAWIPGPDTGVELRRFPMVTRAPKGVAGDHTEMKSVREFVQTESGSGDGPVSFSFVENTPPADMVSDGED